jgi:hypothetical protein
MAVNFSSGFISRVISISIKEDFMLTRPSLLTHIAVVAIGSIGVCATAFAQQTSLPFKILTLLHTSYLTIK